MLPLPLPARKDAFDAAETLWSHVNIKSPTGFVLLLAWLLAALRDRGPYPVLVLLGEEGSAKSTLVELVRALVDPNKAPLRALPREDRDLFIAANNSYLLAYDNVSKLPDWISDTLCRLATGGGFATRSLYTDQDEIIFQAMRPVLLNGIAEFVTRSDLADRCIFLRLSPIPDDHRRAEEEFWTAFEADAPAILGGLLDAMVQGLRILPTIKLDSLPRMADFAEWATACIDALWGRPGTSWMRMNGIDMKRLAMSSTRTWWPWPCARSWCAKRNGREPQPNCSKSLRHRSVKRRRKTARGPKHRERFGQHCSALRRRCARLASSWSLTVLAERAGSSSGVSTQTPGKHRHDRHHRHWHNNISDLHGDGGCDRTVIAPSPAKLLKSGLNEGGDGSDGRTASLRDSTGFLFV